MQAPEREARVQARGADSPLSRLCVRLNQSAAAGWTAGTAGRTALLSLTPLFRAQAGLAKQEELLAAHAKARARKSGAEAQAASEWMTRKERIIKGRTSGAS